MSARTDWPADIVRRTVPEVDSTNAEGLRMIVAGTVSVWVLAGVQTAGRGRRGRPWASPAGNFHATLAQRHGLSPAQAALRSFTTALALREALVAATGLPGSLALKWPNDVLLNGGKVAGILLEASTTPLGPALCIGIGVNLIAAPDPTVLEPDAVTPVTVLAETGVRLRPEALLDALAPAVARWEGVLALEGFDPVRRAWLTHAARLGQPIRARTGQATHDGTFRTIDDTGALVLDTARGTLAVPAAEVFF